MEESGEVNFASSENLSKFTGYAPLHYAVHVGRDEIVDLLLEKGADVNKGARNGMTALHIAADKFRPEIVGKLVNHGANIDAEYSSGEYEGYTPLHTTVSAKGNDLPLSVVRIATLKTLIKHGANVNAISKDKFTPLHLSLETEDVETIKLLLKHGANPNALNKDGKTAFLRAVETRKCEIVELFLENCRDLNNSLHSDIIGLAVDIGFIIQKKLVVVQKLLDYGFSLAKHDVNCDLVYEAVRQRFFAILSHTLELGFEVNKIYTLSNGESFVPLHLAVEGFAVPEVRLLIKSGADVNAKDKDGQPPIACVVPSWEFSEKYDLAYEIVKLLLENHACVNDNPRLLVYAAHRGLPSMVELLLEHGADVHWRDGIGFTVLHKAVNHGNGGRPDKDVIEMLLSKGADINAKSNSGVSVLHIATLLHLRYSIEFRTLLKHKADVNASCDGITPLHLAALRGAGDFAHFLLRHGASVNARAKNKQTALHLAVTQHQRLDPFDVVLDVFETCYSVMKKDLIVDVLLDAGIEIDAKDGRGRTALHCAATNSTEGSSLLETLIKNGATVSARDDLLRTALHYAGKTSVESAKILVSWGADINCKDIDGCTPLHMAAKYGLENILKLAHFGADIESTDNRKLSPLDKAISLEVSCFYDKVQSGAIKTPKRFTSQRRILKNKVLPIKIKLLKARAAHSISCPTDILLGSLDHRSIYKDCRREIDSMKTETVGNSFISYYEIFTSSRNKLVRLAKRKDLFKNIKVEELQQKFPNYANELELRLARMMQSKTRELLLDLSKQIFRTNIASLPDVCIDMVLDYLSDDDLEILTRAYEPQVKVPRTQVWPYTSFASRITDSRRRDNFLNIHSDAWGSDSDDGFNMFPEEEESDSEIDSDTDDENV